jgi:hypothetical protein
MNQVAKAPHATILAKAGSLRQGRLHRTVPRNPNKLSVPSADLMIRSGQTLGQRQNPEKFWPRRNCEPSSIPQEWRKSGKSVLDTSFASLNVSKIQYYRRPSSPPPESAVSFRTKKQSSTQRENHAEDHTGERPQADLDDQMQGLSKVCTRVC